MYDFGLSPDEFGRLTPGLFMALQKRHEAEFRRQSYIAGLGASTTWNRHRQSEEDRVLTPFDFVPGLEDTGARAKLKHNILNLFGFLQYSNAPATEMNALREKTIKDLTAQGFTNVEEIFDEVFASWFQPTVKAD